MCDDITPYFVRHYYRGHSASISSGNREGVDSKGTKNDIGKRVCSQKCDVLQTHSSIYFFL